MELSKLLRGNSDIIRIVLVILIITNTEMVRTFFIVRELHELYLKHEFRL